MKKRTYEASESAKREICSALKHLMTQKSLNKITVAEIMQSCGMARQHFYYHFEDIYDAVHWMFDQEAVALLREHEGVMLWQDGLLQLFQYLQENRAVCLCALRSLGREHLIQFFRDDLYAIIHRTVSDLARQTGISKTEDETDLLVKFYISALSGMAENWLLGELDSTPEQLIRLVDEILQDHLRGAAMRMRDGKASPRSGDPG